MGKKRTQIFAFNGAKQDQTVLVELDLEQRTIAMKALDATYNPCPIDGVDIPFWDLFDVMVRCIKKGYVNEP